MDVAIANNLKWQAEHPYGLVWPGGCHPPGGHVYTLLDHLGLPHDDGRHPLTPHEQGYLSESLVVRPDSTQLLLQSSDLWRGRKWATVIAVYPISSEPDHRQAKLRMRLDLCRVRERSTEFDGRVDDVDESYANSDVDPSVSFNLMIPFDWLRVWVTSNEYHDWLTQLITGEPPP